MSLNELENIQKKQFNELVEMVRQSIEMLEAKNDEIDRLVDIINKLEEAIKERDIIIKNLMTPHEN